MTVADAAAKKVEKPPATYEITLPDTIGELFQLGNDGVLVFSAAASDKKPKAKDYSAKDDENENEDDQDEENQEDQENENAKQGTEEQDTEKQDTENQDTEKEGTEKPAPERLDYQLSRALDLLRGLAFFNERAIN